MDSRTQRLSYGGWRRVSALNPAKWAKVEPSHDPVQCDSMNGNCVLIPWGVAEIVGNIDPAFTHGMGDLDYGFRARKFGCTVWIAPGYVGECDLNCDKGRWADGSLPLRIRWKHMLGPKGLPPREWLLFTYRHSGWLWPICWVNPYVKWWVKGAWRRLLSP